MALGQSCVAPPKGISAWFTFSEPLFAKSGLQAPGKVGTALVLNGNAQYFELPASSKGLDMGSEDFSIEVWVRTPEAIRTRTVVDKRDRSPQGYLLYIQNGHAGMQVARGADRSDVLATSVNVADNRWHHVVAVVKRLPTQPARLYVDGKLAPSHGRNLPIESIDTSVPVWLGRHHGNQLVPREDFYFTGAMDELTFYRRALAEGEIAGLFRAGAAGKCTTNSK